MTHKPLDLDRIERDYKEALSHVAPYRDHNSRVTYLDKYAEDVPALVECVRELAYFIKPYLDPEFFESSKARELLEKWGLLK